jgi:hypothetical protein
VNPRPDARVHDRVVLDEIELYGELIIAASHSDGPLSETEIDEILGVRHDDPVVLAEAAATAGRATVVTTTAAARAARASTTPHRQRSVS